MTRIVLFDDALPALRPLNDLRCAFDVRVGALTNAERLCTYLQAEIAALWVAPAIADLARDEHDHPVNQLPEDGAPLLLLNARLPMPIEEFARLSEHGALVEAESGDVIAARLSPRDARALLESGTRPPRSFTVDHKVLLSRPWHFKSVRDAAIDFDLAMIAEGVPEESDELPEGVMHIGEQRAILDSTSLVYPGATLVCEDGPVVIAEHATIRPGAIVIGPAFIGPGSTVLEHATIRGHTAIGPVCKIAGEVSGCVFQGYSNKAHDGFLGDSWVGEWVNLGAGTTNSNLLNTYGEVLCQTLDGKRERTGETFLGAIIGDHVKTAIGTRLMTGCILHTGSMFAQTAPVAGTVAPFTWATDEGRREYRMSKFLDVMRTMMGRRDVEPSEAYLKRIQNLQIGLDMTSPMQ